MHSMFSRYSDGNCPYKIQLVQAACTQASPPFSPSGRKSRLKPVVTHPAPSSQHKSDQRPLCHRFNTRSRKLEGKLSESITKLTSAAFARDAYVSAGGKCAIHLRRQGTEIIRKCKSSNRFSTLLQEPALYTLIRQFPPKRKCETEKEFRKETVKILK